MTKKVLMNEPESVYLLRAMRGAVQAKYRNHDRDIYHHVDNCALSLANFLFSHTINAHL